MMKAITTAKKVQKQKRLVLNKSKTDKMIETAVVVEEVQPEQQVQVDQNAE